MSKDMLQKNVGPGVVVVGSDYKALGVVRSLGRRHIPCVVVDNLPRSAWFSRYVGKRFRWHGHMDDTAFLHFLLRIAKKHHLDQWVLFPLPDETVELVARHTEELSMCYQLVTQQWDIVRWANDKRLTYRMAQEMNVPCPKTWHPLCEDDLQVMEIAFPVIIKPVASAHLQQALRLKALPASDSEELLAQYRLAAKIVGTEHIMIQEIIPGNGQTQYSVAAYCKEGRLLASMTARRTRQYPIDFGLGSSFVEAIEVPPLFKLAEKLVNRMGVSGMVEVEFKFDQRDDQYKLLDINARPWGWHTLCIACGLDFPFIQYCDLTGQLPPIETPGYGHHWVRFLTDIPAGLHEIRAGITTPGAYLRSLLGKTVFSVFDWQDPLPVFGDFVSAVVRSIPRIIKRGKRSSEHLHVTRHVRSDSDAVEHSVAALKSVSVTAGVVAGQTEKDFSSRHTPTAGASAAVMVRDKPSATGPVGAVIIGGDFQGLGIVRSLGKRGVPTCIIDDETSISRFSRYATHAVRAKELRDERQTVETVLDIGHRLHLEGWVLFPTRDETVAAFSRYRSELAEYFRVPTPELSVVQSAWDKRNTYRLAQELDIPTPRTWYPYDLSELEQLEADLPLVIKPAIKEHFIYATKVKAWRACSRTELVDRFQQAAALVEPGEVMIQELIPGDGRQQFSYCAFFKDGQAVGSMVAQRRRQHPPEFGRASTFVETIDLPLLETLSTRFLQAIKYYGLVELEYKLDPRDGQYKLLDVNARTWGYHSLGQRAGVDFPSMLFADQLGEAVQLSRAQEGVKWVRLATDLPSGAVEFLGGRLDWRAYVRSLKDVRVESVFSLQDPLPGFVELALLPYLFMKRGF
jgi:D-aspartate ligase